MQSLNPQTVPLIQSNLIEASAGTGKTYTLSLLYLRFILESEPALSVENILVVTYTTAATKELKDRIRLRLSTALQAFFDPDHASDEYQTLCLNFTDHTEAIVRLNRALLSFDEASIFTIHSFCQRALKDTAFDAALAFKTELLDNDDELMQSLIDDYWRKNFQKTPPALLALLRSKDITPDSLLHDIRNAVGKPYLKRIKPHIIDDIEQQAKHLEMRYQQAIALWQQTSTEIEQCLQQHKQGLYASVAKSVDTMLTGMHTLSSHFATTLPNVFPAKVDSLTPRKLRVKKGFDAPHHPFFEQWSDFFTAKDKLQQSLADYHNILRSDILDYLQHHLPLEKRRKGVMSFDDLLLQLQAALHSNTTLADTLVDKYKVAMIDEFQDTDPIQYDIFRCIYGKQSSTVFFVGDPKQAIYSFRGADIYTYLKASQETQQQYTLNTNWRSHPTLIAALNQLFSQSNDPFHDTSIVYQQVNAGQTEDVSLHTSDTRAPLRLWQIEATEDKNRVGIMEEVAECVADDICCLLLAAHKGEAHINQTAIEGGDIAVLVRSHQQGQIIKTALTQRGIASVQSAKESIFKTPEATELHHLLLAIAQPSQENQVRRALVGDFFSYRGEDLLAFDENSSLWDSKLQAFHDWHQYGLTHGFIPMMRRLMRDEKVQAKLLTYPDGERRLTNLLHLMELIHTESRHNSGGMESIIRWLQQQARQTSISSNSLQLRLESDNKLVQIVTLHKSKGLEYSIIYCPYLWADSIKTNKDAAIMFHAEDEAHTPCLDIGSHQRETHLHLLEQEAHAENMRLLYVALTRAKYHCTLVTLTQKIKGYIDRSALGWLLSNGMTAKHKNFLSQYQHTIETLVNDSKGAIATDGLPDPKDNVSYHYEQTIPHFNVQHFNSVLQKDHRISSFSGLTYGKHLQPHDHDNNTLFDFSPLPLPPDDSFPRGANAGSCLHEIYEHSDFSQPLPLEKDEQNAIFNALEKWGFDLTLANTAHTLISNSLHTPLPPFQKTLKLANLSPAQRLNEMEFYLPLASLTVTKLQHILLQHLSAPQWKNIHHAINRLSFKQVSGYLKGFIDLIFEHQGQYFVADYKSNTLETYDQAALQDAMTHSHYYLQYLIYSVALHRYLQQRIPDYHYNTHFGGVYYLFIRGMTVKNEGAGVFYDLPSVELINALDHLFIVDA